MKKIEAKNSFRLMSNLNKNPQVKFDHRFGFPEASRCKNKPNFDIFELGKISNRDAQSQDEEFVDYFPFNNLDLMIYMIYKTEKETSCCYNNTIFASLPMGSMHHFKF